jgi:hypothetical protein
MEIDPRRTFMGRLGLALNEGEQEAPTHSFKPDGRTPKELEEMQEYGYVELPQFAKPGEIRNDGYFCGSCTWWEHKPNTMPENPDEHDGFCKRYDFRDRDFGCCNGWEPVKLGELIGQYGAQVATTGVLAPNSDLTNALERIEV